jgi:Mrp family chromosome partitioning ATPase
MGKRVGVLDADIYGHSIPHILGIHQKPVAAARALAEGAPSRPHALRDSAQTRFPERIARELPPLRTPSC